MITWTGGDVGSISNRNPYIEQTGSLSVSVITWHLSSTKLLSKPTLSYCRKFNSRILVLTHWGRVTHICVGNLTIIGSDNGLSPGRRQAITWTNVGILLIGPLGTNLSEMLIEIHTFSFNKIHLKMSGKWRPFCPGLNVLKSHLQNGNHLFMSWCATSLPGFRAWCITEWLLCASLFHWLSQL